MKSIQILSLVLSIFSTVSVWAADGSSEVRLDSYGPTAERDIQTFLVPQIGMSSMGYSGNNGAAGQDVSAGLTVELGQSKARLMETGLLLLRLSAHAAVGPNQSSQTVSTSELAIPLMAKIRIIDLKNQAWYLKFGGMTAFQTAGDSSTTNSFDVLGSAGVSGRFPFSRNADFLVDGTYNRGVINALRGADGVHEGFLFITGLSFRI